jgi:tetratricopeptide (TPR) repeat protein
MDYIEYAMSNYHGRQYDKALDIVKAGLAKEQLNATLNRIAMMCSNELKQFPEALGYAETLFNKVDKDSVNFSEIDYQNYGKALDGCEQFEAAIAKYKEALVLYNHTTSTRVIKYVNDVMEADYQDFQSIRKQYPHHKEQLFYAHQTYGKTYWYYYKASPIPLR